MTSFPRRLLTALALLAACLPPALSQYLTLDDIPSGPAERATVVGRWFVAPHDGFQVPFELYHFLVGAHWPKDLEELSNLIFREYSFRIFLKS